MLDFVTELTAYLVARKRFWLVPVLLALALVGGLIVATTGTVVAPFIYTIF